MLPDHNEAIEISVLFLKSLYHFPTYGQEGHWQSQITSLLQVIHLASHSKALALRGDFDRPKSSRGQQYRAKAIQKVLYIILLQMRSQ